MELETNPEDLDPHKTRKIHISYTTKLKLVIGDTPVNSNSSALPSCNVKIMVTSLHIQDGLLHISSKLLSSSCQQPFNNKRCHSKFVIVTSNRYNKATVSVYCKPRNFNGNLFSVISVMDSL